jgi:two-component system sensor kinase FixL
MSVEGRKYDNLIDRTQGAIRRRLASWRPPDLSVEDTPEAGEIRSDQMASFARQTPINSFVTTTTSAMAGVALWHAAPRGILMFWIGLIWAVALWHLYRWSRRRNQPRPPYVSSRGPRRVTFWAAVGGLLWGAGIVFFPYLPDLHRLILMIMIAGMAAGSAATLGAIPTAAAAFILGCVVPWTVVFFLQGNRDYFALGVMAVIFAVALIGSSRIVYRAFMDRVEARQANAALLAQFHIERNEWLEISDTSEAFALFDAEDRLLLWNENYRRILSLQEDSMFRGAGLAALLREAAAPVEVQQGQRPLEDWIAQQLSLHEVAEGSIIQQLSNGRWLKSSARRTSQGHTVNLHVDITDQKKAEEALQESETRFRTIYESAGIGISLLNREGNPIDSNRALQRMLGYSNEEIAGLGSKGYTDPDYIETDLRLFQELREGQRHHYQMIKLYVGKDDRTFWGILSVSRLEPVVADMPFAVAMVEDITEQKKAEEALRASEKRFQDFAEASADWFWEMDADLRFTYMSPNIERLVGEPPEAHYGKTRRELLGEGYDPERWAEHERALAAREPFRDYVFPRAEAGTGSRWLRTSGVPVFAEDGRFLGYRGTGSDVTGTVEAQEALGASERRYRDLVEGSQQGLVIHRNFKVLMINQAAVDIFGYDSVEEVLAQKSILPIVSPAQRRRWIALNKSRMKGDEVPREYEFEGIRKDGTRIWLHNMVRVVDWDGRPAIQATVIDITERKRAEAALRERETRLRDLQLQLFHVSRSGAMGHLSSALAHELNQPLAAIMNYVQAGRRVLGTGAAGGAEKVDEMLDKALDQAARASAVIRRLRDLFERGETEVALQDVNQVVEDAAVLALVDAKAEGIKYELCLSDDLPLVSIDRIQVQQVVLNLVRNAVEAMAGSERRELTIQTSLDRTGAVEIAVSDTGTGLPPGVLERLYEPFVTAKRGGMGVGLSIGYKIVEAHGGRLWHESRPGGGTLFRFTLPVADEVGVQHVG